MALRALTVQGVTMVALALAAVPAGAARGHPIRPEALRTLKDCSKQSSWGKLLCGNLDVPIDRDNPGLGTTRVSFAYRPPERRPATGITLATDGPWHSAVAEADFLVYAGTGGGAQTKRRAVILVDSRLIGNNEIDCPLLQEPGNDPAAAITQCIGRIGPLRDHLTYADHADDVEDVRRHLLGEGGPKVDFFTTGHATPVAEAYAIRYGAHLRSLILDSAADYPLWPQAELADTVAATRLICRRSALCSAAIRDPEREIAWLARRLRSAPVTGVGYDAAGKPKRQNVDESDLAGWLMLDQSGADRVHSELPAAARALRRGDAVPLLRLAARAGLHDLDWTRTIGFEPDDSAAAFASAVCSEWPMPFDRSASPAARRQQASEALYALPEDAFAPFSREAVGASQWPFPECLDWPALPPTDPILRPGTAYWSGPTLILAGDLNVLHGPILTQRVAARYGGGSFVSIPNAAQAAFGWGTCGSRILNTFLERLKTGRTRCAPAELAVFPAVGGYPRSVAGYRPARTASRADRSSRRDRRVAAAAVHTWVDAVLIATSTDATSGRGLRGGAWSVDWGEQGGRFRLERARLVEDVAVSGKPVFAAGPLNPPAKLKVRGQGTDPGTIRMAGHAIYNPTLATIRVTGRLGGRALDLRVPIH
jgi:hypothetical protein